MELKASGYPRRNIGIIGGGYVGLTSAACLSEMGHRVICADNDKTKVALLKKGRIPIYEPGLNALLAKAKKTGRIIYTANIAEAVSHSEIVFICVGTPPRVDGSADLSSVEMVAREIARSLKQYTLVVEKSTVPVATGERVGKVIAMENKRQIPFDVASNPEFLREGTAIEDFFHPDRIVIGVNSKRAEELLRSLYEPLKAPIVVTDIKSAELIKHASNSFLATKIAYANALSRICDLVGADVAKVTQGMGLDKRIGPAFLNPGPGVGGFCLPKDLDAFYQIAKRSGFDFTLLQAVKEINESQKEVIVQKLEEELWNLEGKTIAVLGLSFKPETDDLRYAPSLDIIRQLAARRARIRAYDPQAMEKAKQLLKGNSVTFAKDAYDCLRGTHGAVLVTDWAEFGRLDFKRIKKLMVLPVLIDGRNFWDAERLREMGFRYRGIGRH